METIIVSFSGGQSSAYMCYLLEDNYPQNKIYVFADTGMELPETHEFLDSVAKDLKIKINRVSRKGGFRQLIKDRKSLPNPAQRFCTGDLKIKPINRFVRSLGIGNYVTALGIRFDEQKRYSNLKNRDDNFIFPLYDAKITKRDVDFFWESKGFKLDLKNYQGNCDFCFMKSRNKLIQMAKDYPERLEEWIEWEKEKSQTFKTGISFAQIKELSNIKTLFDDSDDGGDCYCNIL